MGVNNINIIFLLWEEKLEADYRFDGFKIEQEIGNPEEKFWIAHNWLMIGRNFRYTKNNTDVHFMLDYVYENRWYST